MLNSLLFCLISTVLGAVLPLSVMVLLLLLLLLKNTLYNKTDFNVKLDDGVADVGDTCIILRN